jgi:exodeoxyribonuclease VII large subunit
LAESILTVAELDRRLRRAVEGVTANGWVRGEVGSLRRATSGHLYFCLKDETEDAVIDCVMYRFHIERTASHLADGARVQVWGKPTVWAPRGRLQLVVEQVRPVGRGSLLEALEKLKEKLRLEGLFDPVRKRHLPKTPRVIGVVTSAHGAALHDIVTVAFRRGGVHLVLSAALVQGDGAAESILRAMDLLERLPGLDVMIVGRGGGSGEDLMAFNDERVVRRVALARVPVVSAVGHEIDITLTDLCADLRAATPSQAAELVVAESKSQSEILHRAALELGRTMHSLCAAQRDRVERLRLRLADPRFVVAERQQQLDELGSALERRAQRMLARRRAELERGARRLVARHPRAVLGRARAELGPLSVRLATAVRFDLDRRRARLAAQTSRLEALSPLAVLTRGYAIAEVGDGTILRHPGQVRPGDPFSLRLARGRVDATVVRTDDQE